MFADIGSTTVDAIVMFISLVSIILCIRSLTHSVWLSKTVRSFFVQRFTWKLKMKHFWPLIDGWLVMITISNVMVIVGSVMKLVIAYKVGYWLKIIASLHISMLLQYGLALFVVPIITDELLVILT